MATNTEAVNSLLTALGALTSSSSTHLPKSVSGLPTPAELYDGRTKTVDQWFSEFEHLHRASSSRFPQVAWYSKLHTHCSDHYGVMDILSQLTPDQKKTLPSIKEAFKNTRFPNGQPEARGYAKLRYNTLLDMPSRDEPMEMLLVHKRLLREMPEESKPTDEEQVIHFFRAISPQYQQMLGGTQFANLAAVEDYLHSYSTRTGRNPHTSTSATHTDIPVFLSSGGGDVTRNPATANQLQQQITAAVQDQLHKFKVEMTDVLRNRNAQVHAVSMQAAPKRPYIQREEDNHDSGDDDHYNTPDPSHRRGKYGNFTNKPNRRKKSFRKDKFCYHCKHSGRKCFDTHDSILCFHHPNKEIAMANREKLQALGVRVPRIDNKPPQYPSIELDMADPKVRQFVDQQVMKQMRAMERTFKSTEMLRNKEDKDNN